MHERLKQLRKQLDMTQQEFADRIGIKRNSFANYETGRNTPLDAIIVSICREFNVNEEWLRNGTGSMFIKKERGDEIAEVVNKLLSDEDNTFKTKFITMLSELSVSDWKYLEKVARKLLDNDKQNTTSKETSATTEPSQAVKEAEEAYIKSRSKFAKKTAQSALNTTEENAILEDAANQ